MSEKFAPFDEEPKLIYDESTFKLVVGKASKTNPDEDFCIGLRAGDFPKGAYTILPPQFKLVLLKSLLGEKGSKDEVILQTLAEHSGLINKGEKNEKVIKALRVVLEKYEEKK